MSWTDRYAAPVLVRARGAFEVWTARAPDGAPRVVLVAEPAVLDRLAEGHARTAGGIVPAVAERGAGFVALACDAVTDFEDLIDRFAARRSRCPYAQGIALVDALLDALARATDAGVCFGGLAPANLLVSRTGALTLIGAGHHVTATAPGVAIAPEVAAGGPPTPSGDLYAITLLVRSLIGFVDFPPPAQRVLQGRALPEDAELAQVMLWSNLAIVAAFPDRRPTVREARAATEKVWRLLGATPDRDGYARWLAAHLDEPAPALVIDVGSGSATLADGTRHDLGGRRAPWRILVALAEHHAAGGSGALDATRLFAAGWPGEVGVGESAAGRVYVALSTLRKLGLEPLIERYDGGWRLDPAARVVVR